MFFLAMTIANKKGTMKKYRSEALQIQLPPDNSIARFKINVTEKKNAAQIPNIIGRIGHLNLPVDVVMFEDLTSFPPQD